MISRSLSVSYDDRLSPKRIKAPPSRANLLTEEYVVVMYINVAEIRILS